MSAVPVSESGVRPILAEAVDLARRALLDLEPAGVGVHLGVSGEDDASATHHFEATLPGYRGWQWAVVVTAPPEAEHATVSESALLPGPDALVAPDFIPWDQRVRPGDLAPGDLLAPPADDPRLVPGYVATGDPVVDEVAYELGLGRSQVLSREGREEAGERWYSEFGPDTDMARAAPSTCGLCGFFVPLAGALRAAFGVCANAMGADGHVVHVDYGCGAHSDTVLPTGGGSPAFEAYDDAAVELIPTAELRKENGANGAGAEVDSPEADAAGSGAAVASADADATASDAADNAVAEADSSTDVDPAAASMTSDEPDVESGEEPVYPTPATAEFVAPVVSPETVEAEALVEDEPEIPATAEFVAPVVDHAGDAASVPGTEGNSPADGPETGEITLFDVDPDAGPYDDAWGVAAVKVQPQPGEAEAPESN